MTPSECHLDFVLKVVSRCNLNCGYCYVYNKADSTWIERPKIMPDDVYRAAIDRIRRHCIGSGQKSLLLSFHGGEPTLAGTRRFDEWCQIAKIELGEIVDLNIAMQTNGTLLDKRWTDVLSKHNVEVGISIDGPKEVHDLARPDHRGRGSYTAVVRGLDLLQKSNIRHGALSVIQLGADSLQIHRHLAGLGVEWIDYLLPGFTHDTIGPIREIYGPTPCADFLIPIMNEWFTSNSQSIRVRIMWEMASMILGGQSSVDSFGNRPFRFIFIESDGAIESLDLLRVCRNGAASIGLNVLRDDFASIAAVDALHYAAIFEGLPLPTSCRGCPEANTCAGGYMPHRYSSSGGFDHSSVWCSDLLQMFGQLRTWLDVPATETPLRRKVLSDMAVVRSIRPAAQQSIS